MLDGLYDGVKVVLGAASHDVRSVKGGQMDDDT